MKNRLTFALMATFFCSTIAMAQVQKLPAPAKSGGKSIIEALWNRSSGTEFSDKMLNDQDLSNLLFAAIGVNRPSENKLTSPTARNLQEIRLFVFTEKGVFEYLNKENSLKLFAKGDYRALIADRQEWVKSAPVSLLIVADESKFGSSDIRVKVAVGNDAGIVSENVNLFCAGTGLVTRTRMTMDVPAIKKLLNLSESETPLLNNPVGYPVTSKK
ncbi:MAG: nitroreductase family protein [Fibrobacter sp.]|nr:nitroreductase family protein [Fibrobacter sp.]